MRMCMATWKAFSKSKTFNLFVRVYGKIESPNDTGKIHKVNLCYQVSIVTAIHLDCYTIASLDMQNKSLLTFQYKLLYTYTIYSIN